MNLAEMVMAAEAHEAAAKAMRLEIELRVGREADRDGMAVTKHLPGGRGSVSQRFTQDRTSVIREEDVIAYLRGYYPDEVVEVTAYEVRNPAWLKQWLKGLHVNAETGEVADGPRVVPGVRFTPGGTYSGIAITISPEVKRKLAAEAERYASGRQVQMHDLSPRREVDTEGLDDPLNRPWVASAERADGTVEMERA